MSDLIHATSVIATKRDGAELTTPQIDWVVDAYTRGDVAPEQMSSLLMAIVLRGMTRREIDDWTRAMIDSGTRMDFSGLRRGGAVLPTVDKHSTGGVGDKITLPLAPVVASFGVASTVRPRPRTHGRHARQTRIDPRLASRPDDS